MKSEEIHSRVSEFQPVLHDARVEQLALRTAAWAVDAKLFGSGDLRKSAIRAVVVASVYANLCCPSTPTPRQLDAAARFCLLFFCIDDAEPDALPELTAAREPWSVGALTTPLRGWLQDTHEIASAPAIVRDSFERNFHDYLGFRRDEPTSRQGTLSLEEHWKFRRQTVFIEPYIDLWIMLMGLDADSLVSDGITRCRDLTTYVVVCSNDVCSIERDRVGGDAEHDLNLLHTYQRERSWTEAEAVEHMIADHNARILEFRALLKAECERIGGADIQAFADLLHGIVDGNRAALSVLKFRYPGADPLVARLHCMRQ